MATASLAFLCARLRHLSELPAGKVYVGRPSATVPTDALCLPMMRYDVVLSGRKRVDLPLAAGPTTVALGPGDGHLSPAGTWERQTWTTPHELLCIVARPETLRIAHYRVRRGQVPTCTWHHTNRAGSETFRCTVQAIEARAASASATGLQELLAALVHLAVEECERPPIIDGEVDVRRCAQARRFIEDHFQEALTRTRIANEVGVSVSHLTRLFAVHAESSLMGYVTACRIAFARTLLTTTELPLHAIARQCGFADAVHFVRRFRAAEGTTPGRFRRR